MQTLETSLLAAIATIPTRQDRAASIGTRLGISARDAGLFSQRPQRRRFADYAGQTVAAEEIITRLPKVGETLHLILDGSFTLASTIPVIAAHIRQPCSLTACTLGLNLDTVDLLALMLKDGRLSALRLAMSSYFEQTDKDTARHAAAVLKEQGATVAIARVHCKLQLYEPAKGNARYVLETSSNLRSCNCIESAMLTNDPKLFNWHNRWLTKFFQKNAIA